MLDLDSGWSLDPQHQCTGLVGTSIDGTRPVDLFRLRMGGNLCAHDLSPAGDKFSRSKTLSGERIAKGLVQEFGKWTRRRGPGLVHGAAFCQSFRHDASSHDDPAKARHRDAHRSKPAAPGGAARLV